MDVPELAPTQIGFSTPNWFNPVSLLIRKITRSRASHTFFVYWDKDFEMQMVMEAHELGFRLVPFERFEKHNTIVKLVVPKRPIDIGLRRVAQNFLASHYDYAGLVGMAVVRFGRWLKRKWNNPFKDSKHVFCSEAMTLAMQWSPGYDDFTDDPSTVDPEDLLEYFEKEAGS